MLSNITLARYVRVSTRCAYTATTDTGGISARAAL